MSINLRVKRKQIDDNAIGGEKIRLDSDQALRSRNAADTGDVSILKVDALDKIQLLSVPHVSSDPSEATQLARKGYVDQKIADLINGAPELLDTLNELAEAIADDPNFATTVANSVAAIQSELDATQTGAGLGTDGSYTAPVSSNYLSAATSLKGADSILDGEIKSVADDLAQEILDRVADVDAEETRALAAEAAIQSELDATQVGAGLGTDGAYTAPVGSNYLSAATSLKDADSKLDTELKSVSDDLAQEILDRVADVDAEETRALAAEAAIQSELDATQTGAGLGTDGAYTAPVGSNYLGSAVSLKDADSKLDTQIKTVADDLAQEVLDRIADVDAEETRALAAEAALDGRIDALEANNYLFGKEKIVLTSGDLVSIDLDHEVEPNSIVAFVGRLGIHKDEDYTHSVVGGVSRLTWGGPLTDPGKEQLSVDDVVYVTYTYRI